MTRILADENLWPGAVAALRELGHDVVWIRDAAPGIDDVQVLAFAQTERRLLITQDKGFGDLVFARGLPANYGVILLRARRTQSDRTSELVHAVESRDDWYGIFAVAEGGRTRATELP